MKKIQIQNILMLAMHKKLLGAGPAGLLPLQLIELGLKPIVIEREKMYVVRRRDLKAIVDHIVNEDSNYCFEGGGDPDGKLYTRSKKRGMMTQFWSCWLLMVPQIF
jgi:hypothetical protein